MLSFRIVVVRGASAADTPESSTRRSMSDRIVSGETLRTATLLATRHLGIEDHRIVGVLLDDRQQARVKEADLEQDEERQRAVDLVGERVEDGEREVEPERELDERLH